MKWSVPASLKFGSADTSRTPVRASQEARDCERRVVHMRPHALYSTVLYDTVHTVRTRTQLTTVVLSKDTWLTVVLYLYSTVRYYTVLTIRQVYNGTV